MKTKDLELIYESYINGQLAQMAENLQDYGLYDGFDHMRRHLCEKMSRDTCDGIIVDMVIAYNHIRYR